MSVLGEFRRIDPGALAAVRAAPEQAFDLIDEIGEKLDVDRAWQRLGALMERAGFEVNPINDGAVFLDDQHVWGGRHGDSRSLTAEQVATAAAQ